MKVKSVLMASAAGAAFMPTAQAADMPAKVYAPPPPVAVSWAGMYIGVHLGGGAVQNRIWGDDYNTASFVGGGQIGYNWQAGNFVFGLEADGSWVSGKNYFTDLGTGMTYGSHFSWLATVRGRVGMTFGATGNWLAYATGGVAFTKAKTRFDECCTTPMSYSSTRTGWTFGGGIEHMLSRNWTVGAEVLMVNFGTHTAGKARVDNSAVIGRLKLNYKF